MTADAMTVMTAEWQSNHSCNTEVKSSFNIRHVNPFDFICNIQAFLYTQVQ